MENKKAQNLSITTIILIILGVVVLVVLIIGFTKGWGSVKGFFTGGGSETQQIISQCSIACATGNKIDWCTTTRTIKDQTANNCKALADLSGNPYGISKCPGISCS